MLFLGIDGGGTKTKVYIIDENKKILYEGIGGPSSLDTVNNKKTVESIEEAILPFLNNNKNIIFDSVFAGCGGVTDDNDAKILTELLNKISGINKNTIRVGKSDMVNALYSGLEENGITLISGTGMVAFGNNNGITWRSGGYGYKEGDLGSGYDLGINAIRAVARAVDKRIPTTSFTKELIDKYNLKTQKDVVNWIDKLYDKRTLIASLAPYVTKHATNGDKIAYKICDNSTTELANCVYAVYKECGFKNTTLVIVGSIGNNDGVFGKLLNKKLKKLMPKLKIISPKVDPGYAAALLALKEYNKRR